MKLMMSLILIALLSSMPFIMMGQVDFYIEGSITISNDTISPTTGTLRWTGVQFEGYTGSEWVQVGRSRDTVITTSLTEDETLSSVVKFPFKKHGTLSSSKKYRKQPK